MDPITVCSNMQTMCGTILAILLCMLTTNLPIETFGFSIKLIPIDSILFPKNFTLGERHHIMAEISRNRALNLKSMSSARALNSTQELMKDVPDTIQPSISPVLSNYYVSQMFIGSQQYSPYLMVDTGSADTWVQSDGCTNCFPVKGGNFKYRESSSYRNLPCNHPFCVPKKCTSDGVYCLYKNYYLGGSSTEGWVSSDTFTFSSTNQTSIRIRLAFGCGYDNRNISFGEKHGPNNVIAGVFGLGPGRRSILNQLVSETKLRFSYCLPSWTIPRLTHTFLRFGNDAQITRRAQTTNLVLIANNPAYNTNMFGIDIAGMHLNIDPELFALRRRSWGPSGGFFIDSGTPYTVLVPSAYRILRQGMVQHIMQRYRQQPLQERQGPFDLCYGSLGRENYTLPTMTFHFKRANLVLDSKAVFERIGSALCMAILPGTDLGLNILGAFQQANHRFLIDVRKATVSFAPEICQEV